MIDKTAPDFTLPAVHHEGEISLADYRGRSHLLLAIFVGLYCPFCRRNIVPRVPVTEALMSELHSARLNPAGELPEPLPLEEVRTLLERQDGFKSTPADLRDSERQWPQLKGQFLIDRDGVIRWANVACATPH